MQILTKSELQANLTRIAEQVRNGAVFIYPTDTIYGIGCNALDNKAVDKVRQLKERPTNPFSIIVPSKEWIVKNCIITKETKEWLSKFPGPYTLIFKLKNENAVAKSVNQGEETIGVRIPDHWFSKIVRDLGFPIVTTSANRAARPFMTSLEDLDPKIKEEVDFIIYEGGKKGRPSKIINLVEGKIKER
ncbi:MAG TPA: L-threonylcarbamoyladenylate synthase [Candidatus Nanoarchaeia archaeon]|nr:L-threonylcarbamoyladenylate synthase [Candidatus Nanoarchaeia archaeon]